MESATLFILFFIAQWIASIYFAHLFNAKYGIFLGIFFGIFGMLAAAVISLSPRFQDEDERMKDSNAKMVMEFINKQRASNK